MADLENLDNAWVTLPNGKRALAFYPVGTLSDDGTAQLITFFEDNERIKEHQRIFEDFIDSLPTGITYFFFDASEVTDRAVLALPSFVEAPAGPVSIELFRNATVTDNGAELETYNPVENASFVHQGKFYFGPTVSDEGNKLVGKKFGTTGGFFTPDQAGSGGASNPNVITTNLLLKINNTSGGVIDYINRYFSWFEIPIEE